MQSAVHIERDEILRSSPQSRVGRPIETAHPCVEFGAFCLTVRQRQLMENGKAVALGSRALDILIALLEQPGVVISKSELIARAWPGLHVEESNLRGHIASLRKALRDGEDGIQLIANVQGRGYCFVGAVTGSVESIERPSNARAPISEFAPDGAVAVIAEILASDGFTALLRSAVGEAVREFLTAPARASPR